MRKLALLTLTSTAVLCAQFTPDGSTRLSYPFPAFSRAGERKIQGRDVYLDTHGRNGQPIKRRLFLAFDPVTGYFLFGYLGLGNLDGSMESDKGWVQGDAERMAVRSAAYISTHGILLVTPGPPNIGIEQSSEKAASIDDAEQRAIGILTAHVLEAARAAFWPPTRQVALLDREGKALLGADFSIPPGNAFAGPVSVVGIAESAEGWEITLQGQYKARVALSRDFQPLKAERIDASKP